MLALLCAVTRGAAQSTDTLSLRGRAQVLRIYGPSGGQPIIVSSGDGGWIHLGPLVAEVLAARGYFVVGFDVKAYLASFTSADFVGRVAPVPLATIHSTHDEFGPLADIERVLSSAREPKRLWIVNAADHRFSDNLAEFDRRLIEALGWIGQQSGP